MAVVTHVRNLLAPATLILGGDKNKVPMKDGPSAGALVVVEKVRGSWRMQTGTPKTLIAPTHPQDLTTLTVAASSSAAS